jgi:chromate transporter
VLLAATFVGYRAAGLSGAFSATVGTFLLPWFLATAAAQQLQRFLQHPWLAGFGRGAAPAVIGLFGVMALNLAKQSVTHWAYALLAIVAFGLARWTKVHPVVLLSGGTVLGWVIGTFTAPTMP